MGVRSNLREEEQSVLQLLLALLPLLLGGHRSVLLLVIQEAVEEVLVLEAQLLVHWVTTNRHGQQGLYLESLLRTYTCADTDITRSLTMVENTLLQQHLPHAHSLNTRVDAGALLHLPVDQLCPHTTLPGNDTSYVICYILLFLKKNKIVADCSMCLFLTQN